MNLKHLKQCVAAASLGLIASATQAGVIYSLSDAGILTTQVTGTTTVNFNNGTCGAYVNCTGNGAIVSGNEDGKYASPYGINNRYLSVPYHSANGSVNLTLNDSYNYFGLYWGSVDTYNLLSFYLGDTLVGSFSGGDLAPLLADGNQGSWSSNRYVNFLLDGGDLFNRVVLTSNGYAFESDNHAFGKVAVPEPQTFALFVLGLLGIALGQRRTS
ncbi:MAG TPA: PEP-CTERM sorting domain-containing protein [Dongiaceae bacterium]|nr:PEP-CTERM sorting domain-containing protein [Dongiaceae bacterium]